MVFLNQILEEKAVLGGSVLKGLNDSGCGWGCESHVQVKPKNT